MFLKNETVPNYSHTFTFDISDDDFSHPVPELVVGSLDGVHGEVAQHLFDGGVQILPRRAR